MALRRRFFSLSILAILPFVFPTDGVARSAGRDGARRTSPPRRFNRARPRPRTPGKARGLRGDRARGGSPRTLYNMEPQALRELESSELSRIAAHMYELDAAELARVEAEIRRIQDERWIGENGNHEYADLISNRAARYKILTNGADPETLTPIDLAKLRTDSEFAKVNGRIRHYERNHPAYFAAIADQLESVMDPAKVSAARVAWRNRAGKLPGVFKARGLLRGLQSRRFQNPNRGGKIGGPNVGGGKSKVAAVGRPEKRGAPPSRAAPPPPPKPKPKKRLLSKRKHGTDPISKPRLPDKPKKRGNKASERARPLNEWEQYVRDFITDYDLTEAQRNAALSILREMTGRAVQIANAHRNRMAEAEKIPDRRRRAERLKELNAPIDRLFHDLKLRLDGLLTAAQRSKPAGTRPKRR